MARLGAISLFGTNSAAPCGAAFSLTSLADTSATLVLPDGEIEVCTGQREVVVRFEGALDSKAAFDKGHRLAQQGLDLLSVLGRFDAVIQDAESEHLVWWSEPDGVVLRQVSTTVQRFAVGSVTVVVHDKDGNVVPQVSTQPCYHKAFRYYRLAQTTDDLYNAYRNMYLAFEVLLSSKFPVQICKRKREREIDWLHRALAGIQPTIRLDDLVPAHSPDVVCAVFKVIYTDARLRLFHAKQGRDFFLPQDSPTERDVVSKALQILTHIVLRMAEAWFSAPRMGGGVFFGWVYENTKQPLSTCSMIATNHPGPFQPDEQDLTHERFRSAVKFKTRLAPELQRGREPALFGTVPAKELEALGEIRRIELISPGHPLIAQLLESPLVCDDAARLEVLMHVRATNSNQPKSLFRQ